MTACVADEEGEVRPFEVDWYGLGLEAAAGYEEGRVGLAQEGGVPLLGRMGVLGPHDGGRGPANFSVLGERNPMTTPLCETTP